MTEKRRRSPIALLAIAALALAGIVAVPSAHANGNRQPVCDSGDGWVKTRVERARTEVEVEATSGYVIVEYCVKASTVVERHGVNPGRTVVTIESPAVNGAGEPQAISHVAVREVPVEGPEAAAESEAPERSGNSAEPRRQEAAQEPRRQGATDDRREQDAAGEPRGREAADEPRGREEAEEPEPTESPEPVRLDGSVVTVECVEGVPWIAYDVRATPSDVQPADAAVRLVLTDGGETETIRLGELDADGTLSGRTAWPGVEFAEDGATPVAWPGWQRYADGSWAEVDGNRAWTRGDVTATLTAGTGLVVDGLAYPPRDAACARRGCSASAGRLRRPSSGSTGAGGRTATAELHFLAKHTKIAKNCDGRSVRAKVGWTKGKAKRAHRRTSQH
jgi:hypothetical protein